MAETTKAKKAPAAPRKRVATGTTDEPKPAVAKRASGATDEPKSAAAKRASGAKDEPKPAAAKRAAGKTQPKELSAARLAPKVKPKPAAAPKVKKPKSEAAVPASGASTAPDAIAEKPPTAEQAVAATPATAAAVAKTAPAAKPAKDRPAKKGWNPMTAYMNAGEKLLERMRPEKTITPAQIVKQIEKGPQGPQIVAAFDFDRTLVAGFTGMMLMQERMRRKEVKRAEVVESLGMSLKAMAKMIESNDVITHGLSQWAGKTEDEMEEIAEHLFETKIQDTLFPEMREILEAHRKAGHTLVVATAATRFQVERAVKLLGIDNLLCTELEVAEGKLTGKLVGDSLFGPGKVAAIKRFIAEHGGNLADTHFYADGDEEIGLMEAVGYPHPTNPSKKLTQCARSNGWPILRLQSRGGTKPAHYLKGIAGMATVLPIAQAGLMVGLLTRDKRQAANIIMPTWIQAQLDMAKVKLRVSGRKNLHARRPAIFIFNHRNMYDGMFVMALVKTDLAGIGKKEIGQNIVGKLSGALMPTVYIDRGTGDPKQAAEALKPVVDALGEGYSVMLAPEGTRVRGHHKSVGPFKKGAFHMAMAAGVPVVPIVIRNALDVGSREGPLRPGTVDIAVLSPVPVDGWTRENMADKIEAIRQDYIKTLNDWPDPDDE